MKEILIPLRILIAVSIGSFVVGSISRGPSLHLAALTLSPLFGVFGLYLIVLQIGRRFPDFAEIRRQDRLLEERRRREAALDRLREQRAGSVSLVNGQEGGDLSLDLTGRLSD